MILSLIDFVGVMIFTFPNDPKKVIPKIPSAKFGAECPLFIILSSPVPLLYSQLPDLFCPVE